MITALLLTTLAVTIVASLFWQQQVQVRSIENQRMQLQKQWILRGALDWAKLILQSSSTTSTDLQQPWAAGLAETRLDAYVENGRSQSEAGDAAISGQIVDAQSRLNLWGLSSNGIPVKIEVEAFEKLLGFLGIDRALALSAARAMAATQGSPLPTDGTSAGITGTAGNAAANAIVSTTVDGVQGGMQGAATPPLAASASNALNGNGKSMAFSQLDDLLAVPGYTPAIVTRLKTFAIILPKATPVNINTTSAEVLAARVATLSLADAGVIVARRNSAPFRDRKYAMEGIDDPGPDKLSIDTAYFLVDGKVRLDRSALEVLALMFRSNGAIKVEWIREN